MPQEDQQDYVQAVLRLYRRLHGTGVQPRPADRQLAAELHRRGVPLDVVEIALRLGYGATPRQTAQRGSATARPLPALLPARTR